MHISVTAHSDMLATYDEDNLYFTACMGFFDCEFSRQSEILSKLTKKYLKSRFKDQDQPTVFIFLFERYYDYNGADEIYLGIDSIGIDENGMASLRNTGESNENLKEAIIIYIDKRVIKGRDILQL